MKVVPAVIRQYGQSNICRKGRFTVQLCRRNYYSTDCTSPHKDVVAKLDKIHKRCKDNPNHPIDRKVYNLIHSPAFLEIAYQNIKSKPDNITPAGTSETLDGVSKETFLDIAQRLKTESFEFKPSIRLHIEKLNGVTRPLTIANPRDKIVIEAIRMILSAVYEHTFSEASHGFRPNHSCHSALKYVSQKFKPTT